MNVCRSCKAEVVFARNTNTGKIQIIDAAPHPRGNVELVAGIAYAAPQCTVLTGQALDEKRLHGALLHKDHHASCPEVAAWR